MTKQEIMENYTMKQLVEMVVEMKNVSQLRITKCEISEGGELLKVKCDKCGEEFIALLEDKYILCTKAKLFGIQDANKQLNRDVERLQSEVERYRKAFENAKKERDCQIAEYQKKIEGLYNSLRTLEGNLKVSNMVIENTIKNENGEETNTVQFDNIKQFAEYIKCFYTVNLDYIQKVLQGNEQKQDTRKSVFNFLPTEPIKVADMLINSEVEYKHNAIAKAFCGEDKGTYRIFDIGELRRIAEHLLVYCNHNGEAEE